MEYMYKAIVANREQNRAKQRPGPREFKDPPKCKVKREKADRSDHDIDQFSAQERIKTQAAEAGVD